MRAEPDELQACFIWLPVNQDEVGSDVAIAVIVPLAAERVIEIPSGQRLIFRQQGDGCQQIGVKALAVPSRLLPLVVAPETASVFNIPHSGSRAASPAARRSPARRAAFIASMVSSLGTSGSNGSAFSLAILIIIRRKASDTVRPIAASTAAASFLMRSSMRARTTEFAVTAYLPP